LERDTSAVMVEFIFEKKSKERETAKTVQASLVGRRGVKKTRKMRKSNSVRDGMVGPHAR